MKKRNSWHNSSIMDRILTVYLWILMVGLFLQGSGSLALRLSSGLEAITPPLLAGILLAHIAHAILHITWGLIGIIVLATSRSMRAKLWLGLVFGIFYTLLAIVGTLDSHIFELHLAPSEDAFHWIVGPLTLGLSLLAWYTHLHSARTRAKLFSSRSKAV
ncbi:MAG TPA: hypothetical protein VEH81_15770 [Ktedonobacteraceae bacterium]|nr:hypothetical protein [Ktedonobacteraceae bacterium]